MTYSGYLILLALIAAAMALFLLYRHSRSLHLKCVNLCHRIANELGKRQEHELVVERVFNIIVDHTHATIAILLFSDFDEDKEGKEGNGGNGGNGGKHKQVLRVYGIADEILKAGDHLSSGELGYGFGRLHIDNAAKIYHSSLLRDAVQKDTGITLSNKQNMMVIPISSNQKTHGLLQLISSKDKPYTQSDIKGMSGLGIYLDAAIQNASKIETIRRERDAAKSLYSIGLTISRFLELDEILHHAVKETHRLMKADFSWYMELHDESGKTGIVRYISGHLNEHVDSGSVFPLGGRIVAMLQMPQQDIKNRYVLIKNLTNHEGEGPGGYTAKHEDKKFCVTTMNDMLQQLAVKSGIIVPVASEDHIHGLLCSFSHEPYFFDNFHVHLQQRIANQVLIAINTADYHNKAGRLALVEERQRMSDDLHDNMAQVINGLSLELHSFVKLVEQERDKETLLNRLEALRPPLDQAKATIREGIFELRVPDGIGLWNNLSDFAKSFQQWHDFKVHIDLPEKDINLNIRQQHELLRVVQEALWNIRKHSGTQEAWLSGSFKSVDTLLIQIEDSGTGFSSQELDTGQGIATMQKRISRLKGQLKLQSNSPKGTIISLEIPYDSKLLRANIDFQRNKCTHD